MNIGTGDGDLTSSAQSFLKNIKSLVESGSYDAIAKLFTDTAESQKIHGHLQEVHEDLLREVCLNNLDERTYKKNPALYNCADEILKQLAVHVPTDSLILELLELIEELPHDYQFTAVLRALQALLLNYGDEKAKAYDWSFNTIRSCLEQHKLPKMLTTGYDDEQGQLLEQDPLVEDLLSRYITVGLFYRPLKHDILQQPLGNSIFKDCSVKRRRNLLSCFLVQLLGKPLALLDLTLTDKRKTNSYTLQILRGFAHDLSDLIVDPYYLLTIVEQQARWTRRLDSSKGVFELSSENVFLIAERFPLEGLAIYFYMLFLDPDMEKEFLSSPKVYAPYFIVESCLYLVNKLLKREEQPFQLRGLLLAHQVLTVFMVGKRMSSTVLELDVHKIFCENLCMIVGFSTHAELRQKGTLLLKKYILLYDDEGRYLVLRNIIPNLSHKGLKSYLCTLYKDILSEALKVVQDSQELPVECSGKLLHELLLNVICFFPKGAETDLLEEAEQISAALNIIRYIALSDLENRTGFWNFEEEIQSQFLEPLRIGLNYSIAHYKLEVQQVETNWDPEKVKAEHQRACEMVSVNIKNDDEDTEQPEFLNKERKLNFLRQHLTTLDLLQSLWARTLELVEQMSRNRRTSNQMEA